MDDNLVIALNRGSFMMLDNLSVPTRRLFDWDIIVNGGPSHKWWLSARLLLGLSEQEARKLNSEKAGNNYA